MNVNVNMDTLSQVSNELSRIGFLVREKDSLAAKFLDANNWEVFVELDRYYPEAVTISVTTPVANENRRLSVWLLMEAFSNLELCESTKPSIAEQINFIATFANIIFKSSEAYIDEYERLNRGEG